MLTLLLDSSNRRLDVGLANEQGLIDQIGYEAWQQQSEKMIPELDHLFNRNGITRKDIGAIMVGIGPGSYTGVRIALTIAKVMSFALSVPIYGVSSLHMLIIGNKPTICLMNARSGRSYIGVYQGAKVLLSDRVWTNDQVLQYIKERPEYVLSGDLDYLGLSSQEHNVLKAMFELKNSLTPVDALGINPIYLKD